MSKRPLSLAGLFFALGIVLCKSQMGEEGVRWQVVCVVLFCLLCGCMAAVWHERKNHRAYAWLMLLPVWLALGILCMWWNGDGSSGQEVPAGHKERVTIQGTIYDIQEKEGRRTLYLNHIQFLETEASDLELSEQSNYLGACIAYYDGDEPCSIGNTIQLSGKISIFENATNLGQFDAKSYYGAQGIDFSIFQMEILGNDNVEHTIKVPLYNMKLFIHEKLGQLAGEHASILQAMLLGEKGQMDSEIKALYQKNGISHVLVISGLHFSLIGMCMYQILRRFGCGFLAAGTVSAALLFLYGMMTGFGTSAVRAFIMFAISMGAQVIGTDYDLPSALSAAVLCILAWNPPAIFQAGFLLSVGAVLGIILVIPAVEAVVPQQRGKGHEYETKELVFEIAKRLCRVEGSMDMELPQLMGLTFGCMGGALGKSLWQGAVSGIGIQLATLPVFLYFFYECAPYSVILNCLVLPLLPIVILGAIAALFVCVPCPALGKVVMQPSLWVLDFYEWTCRRCGELPGAQLVTGQPALWEVAVYYGVLGLAVAGIYLWRHRKAYEERKKRSPKGIKWLKAAGYGMAPFAFCLLFYGLFVHRNTEGMQITMLDVGQGQSVYIRSEDKDILYDGGSTDVSKVGQYRIAPFLKASGVDRLELVIVSHMDADHYNGVQELLEQDLIGIDCLMLPQLDEPDESYMNLTALAQQKGVVLRTVILGDTFSMGEAQFSVLHPSLGYKADNKNDTSVVLELAYQDFKMLLTGDVEEGGEEHMIDEGLLREVDVLQAAHHGSGSSSAEVFLQETLPELVFISCGKDNRYGHPSPETMDRLDALGCEVHVTMEEGSIELYVK